MSAPNVAIHSSSSSAARTKSGATTPAYVGDGAAAAAAAAVAAAAASFGEQGEITPSTSAPPQSAQAHPQAFAQAPKLTHTTAPQHVVAEAQEVSAPRPMPLAAAAKVSAAAKAPPAVKAPAAVKPLAVVPPPLPVTAPSPLMVPGQMQLPPVPPQRNEAEYHAHAAHLQYLLQYQQQLLMQVDQARMMAASANPYGYGMPGLPPMGSAAGMPMMPLAPGMSPQQSASMMIRNMQSGMHRGNRSGRNPLAVPDYAHIHVGFVAVVVVVVVNQGDLPPPHLTPISPHPLPPDPSFLSFLIPDSIKISHAPR